MNTICCKMYRSTISQAVMRNQPAGKKELRTLLSPLMPNDPYSSRTAPLTSKRCILYIYSTNIGTGYFKHDIYSPFFLFKMQFVS